MVSLNQLQRAGTPSQLRYINRKGSSSPAQAACHSWRSPVCGVQLRRGKCAELQSKPIPPWSVPRSLSFLGTTSLRGPLSPALTPEARSGEEPKRGHRVSGSPLSGARTPPHTWLPRFSGSSALRAHSGHDCLCRVHELKAPPPLPRHWVQHTLCPAPTRELVPSQADSTRALCRKWNRHVHALLMSQLPFLPDLPSRASSF